jgi:probable rRNA maturation factor
MINVEVHDPFLVEVDPARLEQAASMTLQDQPVPSKCELTIVITGDEQLHQLNKDFLEVDAPTDVLAFPAGYTDPDSGIEYLGDILISFPRAQLQAEAAGHPVMDELQLLVVHGLLHLLGHDHAVPPEKTRMWSAQREILDHLGLSAINPPAE